MGKAMRIRKDDTVLVTGGKDSGKTGRVLRTEPTRRRVFVEGLNMVKRHQRPRSVKDTQKGAEAGGIIEKEGPIHVSNVMLLDPTDNKPTRVGVRDRATASASATRSEPETRSTEERWKRPSQTPSAPLRRPGCASASRPRSSGG